MVVMRNTAVTKHELKHKVCTGRESETGREMFAEKCNIEAVWVNVAG